MSEPYADNLERTVKGRWSTIAPHTDSIGDNPLRTIVPDRLEGSASTGGLAAMEALAGLAGPWGNTAKGGLKLEDTLGQGGMGVVRLGIQQSLARKVAIKTLRDDVQGESASLALLREAWVTGALEHPNIMPVYDMGLDDRGRPLIVLKRIEGVHWGEAMSRRDLAWNLEIMLQVCNALRFAHSRGILHRDIKPENVMIGEFGEVYLLDWGIAVSLLDDGSGRLPLASDATEMAGTPCYMAPEMLGGDGTHLSLATDVYLLGAVLAEILTGAPPHEGADVMEIVRSVVRSEIKLGPQVPSELEDLVHRATAADPDERYATVDEFQAALERHISHRGALVLIDKAELALAKLLADLDRDDSLRTELYDRFGAVRFGFRQALEQWPEARAASRGQRTALIAMAGWELGHGDVRSAELHLADLDGDPPDEIAKQLEEALLAETAERERIAKLERLESQWDAAAGKRTRVFLVIIMGATWTVVPLLQWFGPLRGAWDTYQGLLLWHVGTTCVLLLLGLWAYESMTKTAINRAMSRAGLLVPVGMFFINLGCWLGDVEPIRAQIMTMFWWSGLTALLASFVDHRLFPTAAGYLCSFLAASAFPEWRFLAMSLGNLVLTINAAIIWRPSKLLGEYT